MQSEDYNLGRNDTIPALELELGGSGDNGVESISALNAKLKATSGYENLQASLKDGKLVFTNSSEKTLDDGTKTGEIYTIESAAFGMSGEVGYEKGDADSNTMSAGFTAKVKQTLQVPISPVLRSWQIWVSRLEQRSL